jgi:hypothetical protein
MTRWIRGTAILLVFVAIALATPSNAMAGSDAVLYELSENMGVVKNKDGQYRVAFSSLMGWAAVGTPLCPASVVTAFNPGATHCTITAFGVDNIKLSDGKGPFGGQFTIVVSGDNPVDSPELTVGRGHFSGEMDFSPAILYSIPVGSVTGKLYVSGSKKGVPFTGVFRLPFVTVAPVEGCQVQPTPEQCYTPPLYLLDAPSPLPVDYTKWKVDYVKDDEKALGYPTVRFEISF